MSAVKKIIDFFDKLEDKVRGKLSHVPIIYAFVGAAGIVVFWRGIWHTADFLMEWAFVIHQEQATTDLATLPWWDGPLSIIVGAVLLLISGLFVSNFIGNEIIMTGLRGEKKLTEKTASEVRTEVGAIAEIKDAVEKIAKRLEKLDK